MPATPQLPSRADGVDGLIALADILGTEGTFRLIRTCRTAQARAADPGGDTLAIIAQRTVRTAVKAAGGDEQAGIKAAAAGLGYPDAKTRSNFMKIYKRQPATKGDPELLRLARAYGDAAVYDLIRLARTANNPETDAGRQALSILARMLVDREIRTADVDEDTARQRVADRLGYTAKAEGNSRPNFYKILAGGRPRETRPRSSVRGKA